MKYKIESWKIIDLITLYKEDKLNLSPPYQRNFIWSKDDQDELIDSITAKQFPLPTFFILKYPGQTNNFEMVDGQQRTRTILAYHKKRYSSGVIEELIEDEKKLFEEFELSITLITDLKKSENIEEFYARVNKTGKKLNKPELNKAEFFDTTFLSLNEELADSEEFRKLNLFSGASSLRMNDIDFVSELVTLLYTKAHFDKKDKVDELYEKDITEKKKKELKSDFSKVINTISHLNEIYEVKKTRYRQRNDFFTLFDFINKHFSLGLDFFSYMYNILIMIDEDISPSNEDCEPFREYATNCVTQSNSKKAKGNRLSFYEDLFLNPKTIPNECQTQILEYYNILKPKLVKKAKFYTIDLIKLQKAKGGPLL